MQLLLLVDHYLHIILHINDLVAAGRLIIIIVVQYHLGLEGLINNMCVTARTSSAHMHRIPLLPVAAHLLLLEAAWIAAMAHHQVRLVVRIRHIVVLLLANCLATV